MNNDIHSMRPPYLEYDFSSNVMTITEAQIIAARIEREKLQSLHGGDVKIDIWSVNE